MLILAVNAGGASLRMSLYRIVGTPGLEPANPEWNYDKEGDAVDFASAFDNYSGAEPDVVAHRIVHGGLALADSDDVLLDDRIYTAIQDATQFAPSHNKASLAMIDQTRKRFPAVRQAVVFDHALPPDAPVTARYLGGPYTWFADDGIRRIGFHGISHHDSIERVLARLKSTDARVITIHLGSGASLAAFRGREMVDTTMGMSPLDGIMMGTRAGAIDPGLMLYMLRSGRYDTASLEHVLSKESGLFGCSGISLDTREVFPAVDAGDLRAATAIDVYCDRIRKAIGSFVAVLGGIDALAWSGPVGEHMDRIRSQVHETLGFFGLTIDANANAAAVHEVDADISGSDSRARTFVIHTLEEWAIVRRTVTVEQSLASRS